MISRRLEIFLEFLIFGIVMGVVEDLIAVKIATGVTITWSTVGIIVLIAIPFAFIGEVIVDKTHLFPVKNGKRKKQ